MNTATLIGPIKLLLQRGMAILLMSLILIVAFAPSFHHHETQKMDKKRSIVNSSSHLLSKAGTCQICDYISAQQAQIFSNTPVYLTLPLFAKAITVNAAYLIRLFQSQVHTWTNKGPPSFC
jgi:hypothetical protein